MSARLSITHLLELSEDSTPMTWGWMGKWIDRQEGCSKGKGRGRCLKYSSVYMRSGPVAKRKRVLDREVILTKQ